MKVLLLHNPTAGLGDHDRIDILSRFEEAGYQPIYHSTKADSFPDVLDEPFDLIAIAGGDGTVRKVLSQIERRDAPVVIIPMGTANNIARSLRIPVDGIHVPEIAALDDQLVKLDLGVGTYGDRSVVLVEGIGMGALAATMDEKVGKGEKGIEKIVAARQTVARVVSKAKPFRVSLLIDGRSVEGEFLFVESLLHSYTGPALRLSPPADSGDGALDVILLDEARREEMVAWINSPENSDPPVRIERGRKVVLEWSQKPPLRSDDDRLELPSSVKSIEMKIQGEPLKAFVPPRAAHDAAVPKAQELA